MMGKILWLHKEGIWTRAHLKCLCYCEQILTLDIVIDRLKQESEQRKRARETETEVTVTRCLTNLGDESDEDQA
jgi:hypothetical protein